jgi:hypothetical protein
MDILGKIKKCLALSNENPFQGESETAMAMAIILPQN